MTISKEEGEQSVCDIVMSQRAKYFGYFDCAYQCFSLTFCMFNFKGENSAYAEGASVVMDQIFFAGPFL